MATNNAVNNSLTGQTGTGSFVGSTSPSLTTPNINQINDPNSNPMVYMYAVPSAVNYFQFVNQVTGQNPAIEATGSDTNIQLRLSGKGTGTVNIFGTANGTPSMTVQSGPGAQHVTQFQFPATAAGQTVTFPDLSGTVALSSNTGTAGQVLTSNGAGVAPSYQNAAGGADAAFSFMLMGG